ncbi:MAG: NAD(P)H-dependent oxidoreductase [Ferruginibacter sp.]|nr:NAD(P)H-dependent oxidoreductase [Ferruginibacter sp.]
MPAIENILPQVVIISASVRTGRKSHRVALFFKKFLIDNKIADVEILDLWQYKFPIFEERLRYQKNPAENVIQFAQQVKLSDAVIIVTPEYNGGYPASLKNVTDLLYDEWKRKPVAISMVSDGIFGGTQVITSLLFSLWKIGAWMVPAMFPVPKVDTAFSENGVPADMETEKRAENFIAELMWAVTAIKKMKE